MEIKATSKYDWKTIKRFQHFHHNQRKPSLAVINVIFVIAVVVSALSFVLMLSFGDLDAEFIGLYSSELFLIFMFVFLRHILPKLVFNRDKVGKDSLHTFVFKEEEFTVSSVGNNLTSENTIKWEALYGVYETKDYFYLYISKRQAFIVEKESMTPEERNLLAAHLLKTFGIKYKIIFK